MFFCSDREECNARLVYNTLGLINDASDNSAIEDGGTLDLISRQVLERLIDHARQEIKNQGLDKELDELKAKAQQRIDEERAKLEQQADERIDDEKQKVRDKLKNLLGQ